MAARGRIANGASLGLAGGTLGFDSTVTGGSETLGALIDIKGTTLNVNGAGDTLVGGWMAKA